MEAQLEARVPASANILGQTRDVVEKLLVDGCIKLNQVRRDAMSVEPPTSMRRTALERK